MFKFAFALAPLSLLALGACTKTEESDTSGDTEETDTDDTNVPEPAISVTWNAADVTVELTDITTTGFDFGMAETMDMENGWFGEDCLNGTGATQICHAFDATTATLTYVDTIAEVVANSTTLFDAGFSTRLTYVATMDDGTCYVWGHDVTYYTGSTSFADCEVLTGN